MVPFQFHFLSYFCLSIFCLSLYSLHFCQKNFHRDFSKKQWKASLFTITKRKTELFIPIQPEHQSVRRRRRQSCLWSCYSLCSHLSSSPPSPSCSRFKIIRWKRANNRHTNTSVLFFSHNRNQKERDLKKPQLSFHNFFLSFSLFLSIFLLFYYHCMCAFCMESEREKEAMVVLTQLPWERKTESGLFFRFLVPAWRYGSVCYVGYIMNRRRRTRWWWYVRWMVTPYKNVTQELPRVQKKDHKIYTKANHACKVASESKLGVVLYDHVCASIIFPANILQGKRKWRNDWEILVNKKGLTLTKAKAKRILRISLLFHFYWKGRIWKW